MVLVKQQKGSAPWPQATIGTISFLISLFLWPLVDPGNACLSLDTVNHWWLLLLAPVHHENPWHLACNVVGLWLTGRRLELSVGTGLLLVLMTSAALFTGFLHLALNLAMEVTLQESSYRADCALGFSGVLFAMQVMSSSENSLVGNLLLCLAESLVASYFAPKVSFSGHLTGVLVGLAYRWGPMRDLSHTGAHRK
ncbi:rhomboid-related protein 4-like isoform X3 [Sarcophilus harrisii]|uniref:Peptidase S54 rhomboid domain-containing protein n=1 Tax=Sarcophilus harrisii TaxID=9305 RepID=A0A7N4P9F8_SARHA|nr:rhomboid-related protein 4-like isoform X3 [Sarcophilus harrisii]